eukprot:Rmarinus@m.24277
MLTNRSMKFVFLCVSWVLYALVAVRALPNGSPICTNTPGHGAVLQTTSINIGFSLRDATTNEQVSSMVSGYTYELTLSRTDNTESFIGYVVYALDAEGGYIGDVLPIDSVSQTVECDSATGVTHTGEDYKEAVSFLYTAPFTSSPNVTFYATIVRDTTLHWWHITRTYDTNSICDLCHPSASCVDEATCICASGFYGDGFVCNVCDVGSYCPEGSSAPVTCEPLTSLAGASSSSECTCPPGQYLDGDVCALCPTGTYSDSIGSVCESCVNGNTESEGSTSVEDCFCTNADDLDTCNTCIEDPCISSNDCDPLEVCYGFEAGTFCGPCADGYATDDSTGECTALSAPSVTNVSGATYNATTDSYSLDAAGTSVIVSVSDDGALEDLQTTVTLLYDPNNIVTSSSAALSSSDVEWVTTLADEAFGYASLQMTVKDATGEMVSMVLIVDACDGCSNDPETYNFCVDGRHSCDTETQVCYSDAGATCVCKEGLVDDGGACVEDPCYLNGGCAPGSTCDASTCGTCPDGTYGVDGDTGCFEILDWCSEPDACDPLVTCENQDSGPLCGDCPEGYSGDGAHCVDDIEPVISGPEDAVVVRVAGTYSNVTLTISDAATLADEFAVEYEVLYDSNDILHGDVGQVMIMGTLGDPELKFGPFGFLGYEETDGSVAAAYEMIVWAYGYATVRFTVTDAAGNNATRVVVVVGCEEGDEVCADFDACVDGRHGCSADATCLYSYADMNDYHVVCECNAGYSGDGMDCEFVSPAAGEPFTAEWNPSWFSGQDQLTVTAYVNGDQTAVTTVDKNDGSFSIDVPSEISAGSVVALTLYQEDSDVGITYGGEVTVIELLHASGTVGDVLSLSWTPVDTSNEVQITVYVDGSVLLPVTTTNDGCLDIPAPHHLPRGNYSLTIERMVGGVPYLDVEAEVPMQFADVELLEPGVQVVIGNSVEVVWTPVDSEVPALLSVYDTDGHFAFETEVTNDGYYALPIPYNLATGHYVVRLSRVIPSGRIVDSTSSSFEVTANMISSLSFEGDLWSDETGAVSVSSLMTVTWDFVDSGGYPIGVALSNTETGALYTLGSASAADATFSTEIPISIPDGYYYVYIARLVGYSEGSGDDDFAIDSAEGPVLIGSPVVASTYTYLDVVIHKNEVLIGTIQVQNDVNSLVPLEWTVSVVDTGNGTDWISVDPLSGSAIPGNTASLVVTFTSAAAGNMVGTYHADIAIDTNIGQVMYTASMTLVGESDIEVYPTTLELDVSASETVNSTLTLFNMGGGSLNWYSVLNNTDVVLYPSEGSIPVGEAFDVILSVPFTEEASLFAPDLVAVSIVMYGNEDVRNILLTLTTSAGVVDTTTTTIESAPDVVAGEPFQLTVQARDAFGFNRNSVADYPFVYLMKLTDDTGANVENITGNFADDGSGLHYANVDVTYGSSYELSVTYNGVELSNSPVVRSIAAAPASPDTIIVEHFNGADWEKCTRYLDCNTMFAGETATYRVSVYDEFDNPVAVEDQPTVIVEVDSADAQVSDLVDNTFTVTATVAETISVRVESEDSHVNSSPFDIDVIPSSLYRIQWSENTETVTVGDSYTAVFYGKDVHNNTLSGADVVDALNTGAIVTSGYDLTGLFESYNEAAFFTITETVSQNIAVSFVVVESSQESSMVITYSPSEADAAQSYITNSAGVCETDVSCADLAVGEKATDLWLVLVDEYGNLLANSDEDYCTFEVIEDQVIDFGIHSDDGYGRFQLASWAKTIGTRSMNVYLGPTLVQTVTLSITETSDTALLSGVDSEVFYNGAHCSGDYHCGPTEYRAGNQETYELYLFDDYGNEFIPAGDISIVLDAIISDVETGETECAGLDGCTGSLDYSYEVVDGVVVLDITMNSAGLWAIHVNIGDQVIDRGIVVFAYGHDVEPAQLSTSFVEDHTGLTAPLECSESGTSCATLVADDDIWFIVQPITVQGTDLDTVLSTDNCHYSLYLEGGSPSFTEAFAAEDPNDHRFDIQFTAPTVPGTYYLDVYVNDVSYVHQYVVQVEGSAAVGANSEVCMGGDANNCVVCTTGQPCISTTVDDIAESPVNFFIKTKDVYGNYRTSSAAYRFFVDDGQAERYSTDNGDGTESFQVRRTISGTATVLVQYVGDDAYAGNSGFTMVLSPGAPSTSTISADNDPCADTGSYSFALTVEDAHGNAVVDEGELSNLAASWSSEFTSEDSNAVAPSISFNGETFTVSYTYTIATAVELSILYGGSDISDSPLYICIRTGFVSATKSRVSFNLIDCVAGQQCGDRFPVAVLERYRLTLKDSYSNELGNRDDVDSLYFSVNTKDYYEDEASTWIEDNGDGTLVLVVETVSPPQTRMDVYLISNGQESSVGNSGFYVYIYQETTDGSTPVSPQNSFVEYDNVECVSNVICTSYVAGDSVTMTLMLRDSDDNAMDSSDKLATFEVQSTLYIAPPAAEGGQYDMVLDTETAGTHRVAVYVGGTAIGSSDFLVQVLPDNLQASHTYVWDTALDDVCYVGEDCVVAGTGEDVTLYVKVQDGYDNAYGVDGISVVYGVDTSTTSLEATPDSSTGLFAIVVTSTMATSFDIYIKVFDGNVYNTIANSPATITLEPQDTNALGSSIPECPSQDCGSVVAGTTTTFILQSADEYGNSRTTSSVGDFTIDAPEAAEATVSDNLDGSVTVAVNYELTGSHEFSIYYNGALVSGAAYQIAVTNGATDSSQTYVTTEDGTLSCSSQSTCAEATAGDTTAFAIWAVDIYGNAFTESPGRQFVYTVEYLDDSSVGIIQESLATDLGTGSYSLSVRGTLEGTYEVQIRLDNNNIEGSGFHVSVSPGELDASQTVFSATESVMPVGVLSFTMQARDSYGNALSTGSTDTAGLFTVIVDDEEQANAVTYSQSGLYLVSLDMYWAGLSSVAGFYDADADGILIDDEELSGSPFYVSVTPGSVSASTVAAQFGTEVCALDEQCGCDVEETDDIVYTIVLRDSYNNTVAQANDFTCAASFMNIDTDHTDAQYQEGGSISCVPSSEDDDTSTYSLTFSNSLVGRYTIDVTFDGLEIANSGFIANVIAQSVGVSAEDSTVEYDSGNEETGYVGVACVKGQDCGVSSVAGQSVYFYVQQRDANGSPTEEDSGLLCVYSINNELNIQSERDTAGKYQIEVQTTVAATHAVSVYLSSTEVSGSGFKMIVYAADPDLSVSSVSYSGDSLTGCLRQQLCLSNAPAGESHQFYGLVRDQYGNLVTEHSSSFYYYDYSGGSDSQGWEDHSLDLRPDGSFNLYVNETVAGTYTVRYSYDSQTLGGEGAFVEPDNSRFTVSIVAAPVDPESTTVTLTKSLLTAGDSFTFNIVPSDEFGNSINPVSQPMSLKFSLLTNSGATVVIEETSIELTTTSVTPNEITLAGSHQLYAMSADGTHLSGSPLTLTVTAGSLDYDVSGVYVTTEDGLNACEINNGNCECSQGDVCATSAADSSVTVHLEPRDQFGNSKLSDEWYSQISVVSSSTSSDSTLTYANSNSGQLTLSDTTKAGEYEVSVFLGAAADALTELSVSPFNITIEAASVVESNSYPRIDGNNCIKGSSSSCATTVAGDSVWLEVVTRDAYGNVLDEDPNRNVVITVSNHASSVAWYSVIDDTPDSYPGYYLVELTVTSTNPVNPAVTIKLSDGSKSTAISQSGFAITVVAGEPDEDTTVLFYSYGTANQEECIANKICGSSVQPGKDVTLTIVPRDVYGNTAAAADVADTSYFYRYQSGTLQVDDHSYYDSSKGFQFKLNIQTTGTYDLTISSDQTKKEIKSSRTQIHIGSESTVDFSSTVALDETANCEDVVQELLEQYAALLGVDASDIQLSSDPCTVTTTEPPTTAPATTLAGTATDANATVVSTASPLFDTNISELSTAGTATNAPQRRLLRKSTLNVGFTVSGVTDAEAVSSDVETYGTSVTVNGGVVTEVGGIETSQTVPMVIDQANTIIEFVNWCESTPSSGQACTDEGLYDTYSCTRNEYCPAEYASGPGEGWATILANEMLVYQVTLRDAYNNDFTTDQYECYGYLEPVDEEEGDSLSFECDTMTFYDGIRHLYVQTQTAGNYYVVASMPTNNAEDELEASRFRITVLPQTTTDPAVTGESISFRDGEGNTLSKTSTTGGVQTVTCAAGDDNTVVITSRDEFNNIRTSSTDELYLLEVDLGGKNSAIGGELLISELSTLSPLSDGQYDIPLYLTLATTYNMTVYMCGGNATDYCEDSEQVWNGYLEVVPATTDPSSCVVTGGLAVDGADGWNKILVGEEHEIVITAFDRFGNQQQTITDNFAVQLQDLEGQVVASTQLEVKSNNQQTNGEYTYTYKLNDVGGWVMFDITFDSDEPVNGDGTVVFAECKADSYLDTEDTCQACPVDPGLDCSNNNNTLKTLPVLPNYWRGDWTFTETIECKYVGSGSLNEETGEYEGDYVCLGSDEWIDEEGADHQCADRYTGPLCSLCIHGYYRDSDWICTECDEDVSYGFMFMAFLVGAVVVGLIVYLELKSVDNSQRYHSAAVKIFTSYLQVVSFARYVDFNWPDPVMSLFRAQGQVSNPDTSSLSLDCFLDGSQDEYDSTPGIVFFNRVRLFVVLPFIFLGVIMIFFWCQYMRIVKKTRLYLERRFNKFNDRLAALEERSSVMRFIFSPIRAALAAVIFLVILAKDQVVDITAVIAGSLLVLLSRLRKRVVALVVFLLGIVVAFFQQRKRHTQRQRQNAAAAAAGLNIDDIDFGDDDVAAGKDVEGGDEFVEEQSANPFLQSRLYRYCARVLEEMGTRKEADDSDLERAYREGREKLDRLTEGRNKIASLERRAEGYREKAAKLEADNGASVEMDVIRDTQQQVDMYKQEAEKALDTAAHIAGELVSEFSIILRKTDQPTLDDIWKKMRREVCVGNAFVAVFVVLFLAYPTLTTTFFLMFSCEKVYDKLLLVQSMDVECFQSDHNSVIIWPVIGILLYTIAFPAFALHMIMRSAYKMGYTHPPFIQAVVNFFNGILLKLFPNWWGQKQEVESQKKQRDIDIVERLNMRRRYGFLFYGFKRQYIWWEFVIIMRKVLIQAVSVFMSSTAVKIQGLTLLVILIGSLLMHMSARPYQMTVLNWLELWSLSASILTIYTGLLYTEEDISDSVDEETGEETSSNVRDFLTAMILLINAVTTLFFCVCIVRLYFERFLGDEKKSEDENNGTPAASASAKRRAAGSMAGPVPHHHTGPVRVSVSAKGKGEQETKRARRASVCASKLMTEQHGRRVSVVVSEV